MLEHERRERAVEPDAEERAAPPQPWALSLQQSAGNAAVTRMLQARTPMLARGNEGGTATVDKAPDTKFNASGIREAMAAVKVTPTAAQLEALKALDTDLSGPWATLKWNVVLKGAAMRLLNPEMIDQHVLDVCGPAAALHSSAGRNPKAFVALIREVFERGTAGGKKVNAKLLAGKPPTDEDEGTMSQVDWMVLSAMQDVTNTILNYEGKPGDIASGYLPPGMQSLLKDFAGCVKTAHYSCMLWGKEDETAKASKLLEDHGEDVVVVMAVADQLLHDPDGEGQWKPNHFVRLLEPVVWTKTMVTAKIFTWGSTRTVKLPPDRFKGFVFGYTVGAMKEEITL